MKRKALLFTAIILLLYLSISGEVRVKEIEMKIPTYSTGPDDPSPPLWNLRVYPYPMQTDITRNKILEKYRVVVMENDYIKLLILPDVGGRILAAFDKTNDNFDFIYHNHVIKPGLVALRGAWISGGIEWNFPTLGHTVNTFSPVNYKILENDDGSVTCVVGTEEWVRRMKWEVFISLFPDRSYFKTRIRLFNRTLTHNNGYFWANVAAHAWQDTRVVFPPELQPDFSKQESDSAEIRYLRGYYSIKHWDTEGAVYHFKKALEMDADFTPAIKWLGILYYKSGKTKEALDMFEKVLKRNEDDHTARYYRALSKVRLGIEQRTEEDLHIVSRRAAYRHVAPYVLASLALEREDYKKAHVLLRKTLRNNPDDIKAKVLLVAVERHLDHKKEAEALIETALDEDPIDPLALIEKKQCPFLQMISAFMWLLMSFTP